MTSSFFKGKVIQTRFYISIVILFCSFEFFVWKAKQPTDIYIYIYVYIHT